MIDVKDDELDDVNEKDDDEECHKFLLLLPATPHPARALKHLLQRQYEDEDEDCDGEKLLGGG